MLKNRGVRATRLWNPRCIRRTSQVPYRVRRLTSSPQQDPQRAAQRLCARHAYGISTSADIRDSVVRDADFEEIEGRTGRGSLVDASRWPATLDAFSSTLFNRCAVSPLATLGHFSNHSPQQTGSV
ncbi:hypothetical protein WJX79_008269 [Trebouxia sp. C0005]